jgi:hypothetical protein
VNRTPRTTNRILLAILGLILLAWFLRRPGDSGDSHQPPGSAGA